jgi:predicted deacylase
LLLGACSPDRTPAAPRNAEQPTIQSSGGGRPEETLHEVRRIGTSLRGRPIRAYRLGGQRAAVRAVVLGSIHGDERAGVAVARALKDGKPVPGFTLWVVPTINPDGLARGTRTNARGVDLNRNWRHDWAPLASPYYSGTRPFSEPESRAFRDFLARVRPRFVVSFHQPFASVGLAGERPGFTARLSQELDLRRKRLICTGVCHGTMTDWYNSRFAGTAVTVEFGAHPSRRYLRGQAAHGTLRAILGSARVTGRATLAGG